MAPDTKTPQCPHQWEKMHAISNYGTGSVWYRECVRCGVQTTAALTGQPTPDAGREG